MDREDFEGMMGKEYYVYIATNKTDTVLYTGVTSNLGRRFDEHRSGVRGSFTSRYKVTKLVYYEAYGDPHSAISREKQIKAGSRVKKIALVESMNPDWEDLAKMVL